MYEGVKPSHGGGDCTRPLMPMRVRLDFVTFGPGLYQCVTLLDPTPEEE